MIGYHVHFQQKGAWHHLAPTSHWDYPCLWPKRSSYQTDLCGHFGHSWTRSQHKCYLHRKPSLTCHLLLDDINNNPTYISETLKIPSDSMILVTCSGWEHSHPIHHGTRQANRAFWKSHMLNKWEHDGMAISTKSGVKRTTAENQPHSLNTLGLSPTRNLPMSENLYSLASGHHVCKRT